MTDIERHLLFDIWVSKTLERVGISQDRYITNHFQFKSGEHLTTLLFNHEADLKFFKKEKGVTYIQQASKSTGIYTLIGVQHPVVVPADMKGKIPEGLKRLTSIDILQGTMFGDRKSPGGVLNQIIPFDLFE